jgi:hypothetical protein
MVQAPQRPAPQPYLVPVNPTWSRIAHNSGVPGSASSETCRLFKVNETMLPPCGLTLSSRTPPDDLGRRKRGRGMIAG